MSCSAGCARSFYFGQAEQATQLRRRRVRPEAGAAPLEAARPGQVDSARQRSGSPAGTRGSQACPPTGARRERGRQPTPTASAPPMTDGATHGRTQATLTAAVESWCQFDTSDPVLHVCRRVAHSAFLRPSAQCRRGVSRRARAPVPTRLAAPEARARRLTPRHVRHSPSRKSAKNHCLAAITRSVRSAQGYQG